MHAHTHTYTTARTHTYKDTHKHTNTYQQPITDRRVLVEKVFLRDASRKKKKDVSNCNPHFLSCFLNTFPPYCRVLA
jgi:hypothetical protein